MSQEGGPQVPPRLLDYEKLWQEMYGTSSPNDHLDELESIASDVKETNPEFEEILNAEEEQSGGRSRGWILVNALSKYGLRFNLQVD